MAPSEDDRKRVERSYFRFAGVGVEYFATLAVLALLGVWLDSRFGTSPLLTIVLAFVGFVAATWNLIRTVLRSEDSPGDPDSEQ